MGNKIKMDVKTSTDDMSNIEKDGYFKNTMGDYTNMNRECLVESFKNKIFRFILENAYKINSKTISDALDNIPNDVYFMAIIKVKSPTPNNTVNDLNVLVFSICRRIGYIDYKFGNKLKNHIKSILNY